MSNVCCLCGLKMNQKKLFGDSEEKLISFFEFSSTLDPGKRCLEYSQYYEAMKRCNISWRPNKRFFVCSRHFNPETDYHCGGKKPKLNHDAKPSIPTEEELKKFQLAVELQKMGENVISFDDFLIPNLSTRSRALAFASTSTSATPTDTAPSTSVGTSSLPSISSYHIDETDWFDNLIDENKWKTKYEAMERKYLDLEAKYNELKNLIEITGSVYAAKQLQLDMVLQKHEVSSDDSEAKQNLEHKNKRQKLTGPNSWRCMALS